MHCTGAVNALALFSSPAHLLTFPEDKDSSLQVPTKVNSPALRTLLNRMDYNKRVNSMEYY